MGVGALYPGHNRRNIAMIAGESLKPYELDDFRFLIVLASIAMATQHCGYCGHDLAADDDGVRALDRLERRGWVREVRTDRALYHEVTWLGLERLRGAVKGLR